MIKIPNDHVALSINSLVLCTPKEAEDVPPNVPERPPPFWILGHDNNDQKHTCNDNKNHEKAKYRTHLF